MSQHGFAEMLAHPLLEVLHRADERRELGVPAACETLNRGERDPEEPDRSVQDVRDSVVRELSVVDVLVRPVVVGEQRTAGDDERHRERP
jgi:hypothetical protein